MYQTLKLLKQFTAFTEHTDIRIKNVGGVRKDIKLILTEQRSGPKISVKRTGACVHGMPAMK